MTIPAKPLLYLILGAAGSGRREALADLIDGGLAEGDRAAAMLAEGENPDPWDARLPNVTTWKWTEGAIEGRLPEGANKVFFVSHGRHNPVDQIEAFKAWIETQGGELGRILLVVNCQLAEKHPALLPWFEACIHFADVALLTRRDGVQNKWLSDFRAHFRDLFYPCLFELVKHGRVANPAMTLDPQARRISHLFDPEPDWIVTTAEGEIIDADEDDDSEIGEDVAVTAAEDEYLARDATGRRVKRIPDIADYLDSEKQALPGEDERVQ
jgi:hypothetical protein